MLTQSPGDILEDFRPIDFPQCFMCMGSRRQDYRLLCLWPRIRGNRQPLVHRHHIDTHHRSHNLSHFVQLFLWRTLFQKYLCPYTGRSCSRRDTDLTRPHPDCSNQRPRQDMGTRICHWWTVPLRFSTCSNEPATALFRGSRS